MLPFFEIPCVPGAEYRRWSQSSYISRWSADHSILADMRAVLLKAGTVILYCLKGQFESCLAATRLILEYDAS